MARTRASLASEYPPYAPQGPYGCVLLACAIAGAVGGWIAGTVILLAAGQFDTESGDTLSWLAVPVIAVGVGGLVISLLVAMAARIPVRWGRPWLENVGVYLAALAVPAFVALVIFWTMPEAWAIPAAALVIAVIAALVVAWWNADSPPVRRWRRRLRPERPQIVRWSDPFAGYDFMFDLPDGWVAGDPTTLPGNLRAFQQDHPDFAPKIDRLLERQLEFGRFAVWVTSIDADPPTISLSRRAVASHEPENLDAWVASMARQLEAMPDGQPNKLRGEKVRLRSVALPFGPATMLSWEYVGVGTVHRSYWFDQGPWRQSLHFSCHEDAVEANEPVFEQIVGSFRVKGPDGTDLWGS